MLYSVMRARGTSWLSMTAGVRAFFAAGIFAASAPPSLAELHARNVTVSDLITAGATLRQLVQAGTLPRSAASMTHLSLEEFFPPDAARRDRSSPAILAELFGGAAEVAAALRQPPFGLSKLVEVAATWAGRLAPDDVHVLGLGKLFASKVPSAIKFARVCGAHSLLKKRREAMRPHAAQMLARGTPQQWLDAGLRREHLLCSEWLLGTRVHEAAEAITGWRVPDAERVFGERGETTGQLLI